MAKDTKEPQNPQEEVMKLRAVNNTLQNQISQLGQRLNDFERSTFFARLDWLWRVITWEGNAVFGDKFIKEKVDEFIEMMTPDKSSE